MNSQVPSDLEDRVRDAYQAAGQTVQPQTLRRTTLRVDAGSSRRPRRLNALIPVAAAVAVLAVIGASVALSRLLTGSASPAGKPGISASALAHEPPFQVIVTRAGTGTSLLVRTPAGHVDSTLAPPRGTTWGDVAATGNPRKFIVATSPSNSETPGPTRLYTLTLSAFGTVTSLTPLAIGPLSIQLGSLAADADASVIAFSGARPNGWVVGAVIGNQVKQWSVSDRQAFIGTISVTSAGNKIAFVTQYNGPGSHFAAMVLATGSAPGPLLTKAKTVGGYDYRRTSLYMFSVAISPDGNWVYAVTGGDFPPGANPSTTVTAYSVSRPGAPVTIATWNGGEPALLPIGNMVFAWMWVEPSSPSAPSPASTAYLINPATRTKTAVRLPGLPSGQYSWLAW